MGPVESNPDRYAGAWRLLIWAPLLVLAVASRFVVPPDWTGLVALWGWAPLVVGLAAVWAAVGFLGVREWRRHTDRLETIPIRIHVDGSRGKTGTCRLIGAALRANGLRVVVKTTGKMPVLIDASGNEKIIARPPPPTANLREQKEIVRLAAEQHAQAIVVECMAVDPELRRTSENTLIRATLAVITNVRRDHLEVIGPDIGTGARNLSDVIPPNGTVVTAEHRLLPPLEDEAEKRHAKAVTVVRELEFRSVIVTSRHTKAFVRAAVRNGYPRDRISEMEDATPREILEAVDARAPPDGAVFACGNMVTSIGYGLVEELLGGGSDGHAGS